MVGAFTVTATLTYSVTRESGRISPAAGPTIIASMIKRIKVKKFVNKSRNESKSAFGLDDKQYDLINSFIRNNGVAHSVVLLVELAEDGEVLSIKQRNTGSSDMVGGDGEKGKSGSEGNALKLPKCEPGTVNIHMDSNGKVQISGQSKDKRLVNGFAVIGLIAGLITCIKIIKEFIDSFKKNGESQNNKSEIK